MQNSLVFNPGSIGSISPLNSASGSISGLGLSKESRGAQLPETFAQTLAGALGAVNQSMNEGDKADESLVNGTAESLHGVQIAGVKSDIMMKLTTTITSKLAQATTQLFQMQV